MENTAISNQQISASSQLNVDHAATQGRLYFEATSTKAGAWSAGTNDVNQWLQIDLGMQQTKVTGVATQGRNGVDQWVTKYKLQYSDDGQNFQNYREGQNTNQVGTCHWFTSKNDCLQHVSYIGIFSKNIFCV